MLARWQLTAIMAVAVMSTMVTPVAGGTVALIIDSQEGGVGGVLSRRQAIRGRDGSESLSSRSEP